MKTIILITLTLLFFKGCSTEPKPEIKAPDLNMTIDIPILPICDVKPDNKTASILSKHLPKTYLIESGFNELPNWHNENYDEALSNFINSCKTRKTRKLYDTICKKAKKVKDSKKFIQNQFAPYKINTKKGKKEGLLTGYYEPSLRGSLRRTSKYKHYFGT